MQIFSNKEYETIEYILGKNKEDNYFTQEELEFVSKMDLLDPYMINVAKRIWENKDDTKELNKLLKMTNMEVNI